MTTVTPREAYFVRWLIVPMLCGAILGHTAVTQDWVSFWGILSVFLWHLFLSWADR